MDRNDGRRPPASRNSDDAWASLDEAQDDWRERADLERQGGGRTATNLRIRMEHTSSLRATDGPHLVVVAGAEVGRIYPLAGTVLTVGRGEQNDLVLVDASVSRQHARLERIRGHWYVHDLGSGNGTFVQAKRVQSAVLVPGEQVAFGQVRMQLRAARLAAGDAAQAAPPPERAPAAAAPRASAPARLGAGQTGRSNAAAATPAADPAAPPAAAPAAGLAALLRVRAKTWLRAGLAALLAVLLGGWLAVYLQGRQNASQAFRLVQRGAKAFAAQELDEAERHFVAARGVAGAGHAASQAHRWQAALARARTERDRLDAVRTALNAGNLAEARTGLLALAGSVWLEAVENLEVELDRAEKALLVEAQTALAANLKQEASALLLRFGDAAAAPRADRQALARWQTAETVLAPLLAQARLWQARPHKKPSLWEQADGQSPALRRALRAYRAAPASAAARTVFAALGSAYGARERQVAASLQHFAELYETGLEEHHGKRAFAAIRLLTEAKQIALAVGGEASRPVRDLDAKLADMYYVVGVQALLGQRLPEAGEALRMALALNAAHTLSERRLLELGDRAVRVVDQAEFIKKTHPERAKELLRQVSAALPGNEEVGERARRLLRDF